LRDNKTLLANNQELSVNNLTNIQALQASTQASEYNLILNQALQIALDVQAQVRKLQSSR
jgi:thiamine monophosphate synthase